MSLSGEYLCVAQLGKEGIFMYVDRSLFETVHFWKEPEQPSAVADSLVTVEEASRLDQELELEGQDELEPGVTDNSTESGIVLKPAQAQVTDSAQREPSAQRAPGVVTLSDLPKAYWTSLFRLEEIKERNRPQAPPQKPSAAPFFLPTVVRDGATSSFPTPAEYAKIQKDLQTEKSVPGTGTRTGTEKSKSNVEDVDHADEIMSGLTAVWEDDGELDASVDVDEESGIELKNAVERPPRASSSRITKKFKDLPR
jgi:U3 small nucleolar RNA-associated protein 21